MKFFFKNVRKFPAKGKYIQIERLVSIAHVYTKKDLENIDEAIEKLQLGKRVVSVSYGNHTVRYADINLNDLLALRQKIKASLGDSNSVKLRHMHFSTHKGTEHV